MKETKKSPKKGWQPMINSGQKHPQRVADHSSNRVGHRMFDFKTTIMKFVVLPHAQSSDAFTSSAAPAFATLPQGGGSWSGDRKNKRHGKQAALPASTPYAGTDREFNADGKPIVQVSQVHLNAFRWN